MKCLNLSLVATLLLAVPPQASAEEKIPPNLETKNLAAWCIVPFDAKNRSPAERAAMLKDLGILRCAYDWRDQHIAEFEEEILQYKKHGIEYFAFWGGHEQAFELFKKHDLHPQIWRTAGSPSEGSQEEKVAAAAHSMEGIAKRTAELGCKLGLYNHGGWGGEPANLVAVCKTLREHGHPHVGIVYNWHHGHGHIEDWKAALALMKPYLLCLNLNGMNTGAKPKILPLAQGEHDLAMLTVVLKSGYVGPIGILDHQDQLDSKQALQDNLDGLNWLKKELLKRGSGGAKPQPKARPEKKSPETQTQTGGLLFEGKDAWRQPPITVECRVKLRDARNYNIFVASDTKASAAHWEIFSMNGSGTLTAYLPGATPDHVRSNRVVTDDRWHAIAMQYAPDRVRLWVDGQIVADQAITLKPNRRVVPGQIGIARLVEGQFGLRGEIDRVRIRRGIHADVAAARPNQPLVPGAADELAFWDSNDLKSLATAASPSREPLDPTSNPHWQEHINRDRVYDFYAKQALRYGKMKSADRPEILPEFPGIDGGSYGHWGNQNDETTWKDGRLRDMDHGPMVSGVFRGAGLTIPRGVAVSLGGGFNAVFDQDTMTVKAAWQGELVKWSDVRHGFMHGIPIGGKEVVPVVREGQPPAPDANYLGLYREGDQVVFVSLENGTRVYRAASVKDGRVIESTVAKPQPGKPQWPARIRTRGELGEGQPYAVDTLTLPYDNPWQSLFFVGGLDFVSEKRIAICNIHGDVWICDVSGEDLAELTWKRFAAGLHQPLGLKVVDGLIHVMCRDQIVALHDLDHDDEADFYERVSGAHRTSAGGHDFVTGLQRDRSGRWYFASGNQGLCRVSADGRKLDVLGTGFRNPNGLGISPDGKVVLTGVQEGNWTPASAICDVSLGGHFGAGGPMEGERGYVPPMLYLPRGVDNSCGGQAYIDSDRWGQVRGQWLHFSEGAATHFLLLREVIDGQSQAAAVSLHGEFLSGCHRGRFSPYDGQLYVASSQGWGSYGIKDGALQRVRFTGGTYHYPIGYETRANGILLTFAQPQPAESTETERWFAQQWNYLYAPAYGSPEFSVSHPDKPGHDLLEIRSVHRLGDGTRVFVEIPQLHPVDQLHLHFAGPPRLELFATVHRLGAPFADFPNYERIPKTATPTIPQIAAADLSATALINACAACHHPTKRVVGPPLSDIRQRYANNPNGIVKWAMNPENKNPDLPPMPSFQFLGEEKLKVIAAFILQK